MTAMVKRSLVFVLCWTFSSTLWAADVEQQLRQAEQDLLRQALQVPTAGNASGDAQSSAITRPLPSSPNREQLPTGLLNPTELGAVLARDFAGTFSFYEKLNSAQKQQVFQLYQRDNRVSAVREQTLRLQSTP